MEKREWMRNEVLSIGIPNICKHKERMNKPGLDPSIVFVWSQYDGANIEQ